LIFIYLYNSKNNFVGCIKYEFIVHYPVIDIIFELEFLFSIIITISLDEMQSNEMVKDLGIGGAVGIFCVCISITTVYNLKITYIFYMDYDLVYIF
jgi:hypothetical protein